jgi:chemotaxis protein CheC
MNSHEQNKHPAELWLSIVNEASLQGILRIAMYQAARNLSEMIRQPFEINSLDIKTTPINQLTACADDPEAETVGIYLLSGDDLPGQAILMMSRTDAMSLIDEMLREPPGTTTDLDSLGRSALAEIGNLVLSSFLNSVTMFTGKQLRPSPPAVMVDMLATVLQTVVTTVGAATDDLLIVETEFAGINCSYSIRFWLLPDLTTLATERIETVKATYE